MEKRAMSLPLRKWRATMGESLSQPLDKDAPAGELYVAADPGLGTGEGDIVFVVFSRMQLWLLTDAFADATIVGFVDKAEIEEG